MQLVLQYMSVPIIFLRYCCANITAQELHLGLVHSWAK